MKYKIVFEKGQEFGYVAYAPALKGCVSQGKTREETLKNIRDAMALYVEALTRDGLPLPVESSDSAGENEAVK